MIAAGMHARPELGAAWLATVLDVAAAPKQRMFQTVTRITDVTVEDPAVRGHVDALLDELGLQPVGTVANTIFPAALAAQTPDPNALGDRYRAMLPTLRRLHGGNRSGTYFGRLVDYPTADGSVNQLAQLVRSLHVERARARGPMSARYEASLVIPGEESIQEVSVVERPADAGPPARPSAGVRAADVAGDPSGTASDSPAVHTAAVFTPGRDTSPRGFPCLSSLSFQLDGERLHAVAHYRSQNLVERGYGNYLGIAQLLRYLAASAGVEPGQLTVVAGRAEADHLTRPRVAGLRQLSGG